MTYTRQIPHPSNSHSLTVTYRCLEWDEEAYKSSVCEEILDVEKDWDEEGREIQPDWLDVDYINSIRL